MWKPLKSPYRNADKKNHPQREFLNRKLELIKASMIESLVYVGESALRTAREGHKYKDQTGNLTSSIGYCILDEGRIVFESSFDTVLN